LPKINSAVDFGCGTGTWLSVLRNCGIKEIKGYDGYWVERESLKIPQEYFTVSELNKKVTVEKRYDLAISIEVAEHLPEESAKIFVETLIDASDIVLFSAAIPCQGGRNHINEQWQDYWYTIFDEYGYAGIDYLRKKIWNEKKIKSFYRQNIMLYVKKEKLGEINVSEEYYTENKLLNIVHPEMFMGKIDYLEKESVHNVPLWALYKVAIKRSIKKITGKRNWELLKRLLKLLTQRRLLAIRSSWKEEDRRNLSR
jgi:hypothetical protein